MDDKELHAILFSAIQHHNDSLLDDLLNGDDGKGLIDKLGDDGASLLHFAVGENDLRCVECLLKHGANPNIFDSIRARTPLHLAVELGQTEIVKAFLESDNVNLDLRDDRNLTCHEIAQFCDNQTLAELIQFRYKEIEKLRNSFYTVMNQACATNEPNLVRELLDKYCKQISDRLPRGCRKARDSQLLVRASLRELINWSSSSWNDVTLLFKSASKGHTEVCRILIEYGATAKCNENTNYSPLYVAAYGGFTDTVRLLLDNFPHLVKEVTIEKWTVLHACCLQGHSETTKLILNYNYPDGLKERYVSRNGSYEYRYAFDLNAQDAAGQTVIYLAVSADDEKLLDTLLLFRVEAKLLSKPSKISDSSKQSNQISETRYRPQEKNSFMPRHPRIIPDRPKLNDVRRDQTTDNEISKIMKRLKIINKDSDSGLNEQGDERDDSKFLICPFEMDTYCDYNSKTALHLAVCQQHHTITTTLLVNGSNPNLPILSRDSIKSDFTSANPDIGLNWLRSSKSTCLKEAARLNDVIMCDILIRYGASDNQNNLALQVAASNQNNRLISKFLSLKSNVDPEYKINKKCNVEFASRFKQSQKLSKAAQDNVTTTFSSMFPSTPVMIDWQNLRYIKQIDTQWLIDASLVHNKRLKHPTNSLMAITRLDLSANNLKTVHPIVFRLPSLRELNLSKNRLESLLVPNQQGSNEDDPTMKLIESHKVAMKRSKSSNLSSVNLESSNIIDINTPQEWDLPNLETLDLHDNLLMSLPDCLFGLPRLKELDISSNQIRQLPWAIWTSPALREVIASGNLLDDLPKVPSQVNQSFSPTLRYDISESPIEERSSVLSDQSFNLRGKSEGSFLSSQDSGSNKETDFGSLTLPENHHDVPTLKLSSSVLPINHLNYWKKKIDIVSDITVLNRNIDASNDEDEDSTSGCKISYLNLSHNSFETIPPVLACMATELTRLNLSYNRITSLSDICLYPERLKTLDLSNNQISDWFVTSGPDTDLKHCYAENARKGSCAVSKFLAGHSGIFCTHKIHNRLENLKMINFSYNRLKSIEILIPSDLNASASSRNSQSSRSTQESSMREQLLYPNITALDVSYNKVQQVPKGISGLKDLSVLNLSGNTSVTTLPAELGLATKLWNLGLAGCNLSEPLKSIVESKTYKTIDVVGYLRSILEEAKPYARMKLMLVGLQGIGKTSLLEQMRQEGTSGSRRKAPEHWTKRMGHTSRGNLRNQKGVTLSTVGVDIHDWIFCKRVPRNQHSFGPVTFSTWDFGGQEEFYATHRYFLSRRSMYLVVWKLTDGLDGILGIQQWLVNIQSRASGSPVIIVGTHADMIEDENMIQQLQAEVFKRFVDVSDHDKCGLPRVMDSMVVSTKTKLNIKNLCNRIYDVVFALKSPGSNERLLEQKIPATYLYLEEIVSWIVHERQQKKREPVLTYQEYKKVTSEQLKLKHNKEFRDLEPVNSHEINHNSELQQATRFLHENGILLHYEDANLRDLYFLDPQWLCDILSHVVTIKEINPHVKNGLMKMDDLGFIFKSIDVNLSGGIQSYVVNLLNKFEVALTWNSQYLLIPSLLPSDPNSLGDHQDFQMKVPPRTRGRSAVRRYEPSRAAMRAISIGPSRNVSVPKANNILSKKVDVEIQPERTIYRFVLLRYLPAGFLARLQSGILSDPDFDEICSNIVSSLTGSDPNGDLDLAEAHVGNRAGWTCWKKGIRLELQKESTINCRPDDSESLHIPLLSIQELSTSSKDSTITKENFLVECTQTGGSPDMDPEVPSSKWCEFDITQYSNLVVISIPNWRLRVRNHDGSTQHLEPDKQSIARLLANSVDHIDNLLEDWYPSLGARFAHTLGGNYLVTRIIPCLGCSSHLIGTTPTNSRPSRADQRHPRSSENAVRFSISSRSTDASIAINESNPNKSIHCFYVENCILQAYNISSDSPGASSTRKFSLNTSPNAAVKRLKVKPLRCPNHGSINLSTVAPDILFEDIEDTYCIQNEQLERCKLIGRGSFGFVFKGTLRSSYPYNQLSQGDQEVALKLLQPVDPGPEAENTDVIAYKSARSNWIREPFHCACKSYCTARHEINILQALHHPNIVHFIGFCIRPLAIVLELAPLGCLMDILKNYKRAGMRVDQITVQKTLVQIARALEFLHQQRIIYRDLKGENVLVWSFPSPFATQPQTATVELKLADYGISRQALSTGIWKGFAGTINFLAPEILRHNGDEEYTEKVDCFSFGMFMYELLTLRPPFKHNEGAKSHLTDGGRPTLTTRDMIYPNYMIDLMSVCWSQEPHHRPTASQIVSIVSTPEFMQLLDVVAVGSNESATFRGAIQYIENNEQNLDLWLGKKLLVSEILSANQGYWTDYQQLNQSDLEVNDLQITCMSVVGSKIWLCDSNMAIHTLPLGSRSSGQLGPRRILPEPASETLDRMQSFPLKFKASSGPTSPIKSIIHVERANCALMLSNDGSLWICQLDTMICRRLDDGSIQFTCVAIMTGPQEVKSHEISSRNCNFQIFCGQSNGISSLDIVDGSVQRQSILPLACNATDLSGERIVEPSQSTEVSIIIASRDVLWTAAGCTVHLWSIAQKCVARKLDCWKLVPCSESLESINIEQYYQESSSSIVSSMIYLRDQLFVGTSHGCFMVIEASSLKPMIVFRPYESNITILSPTIVEESSEMLEDSRYLVTLGTGYRDLMKRFVGSLDTEETRKTDVAILWSANNYNSC